MLEGTVTTLPLVSIYLLTLFALKKREGIFLAAFLSGIALDLMLVNTLGMRSLFFILSLFVLKTYEKKFETQTLPFVFLVTFLGSIIYFTIFHSALAFTQTAVSLAIAGVIFFVLRKSTIFFNKREL